MGAKAIKEGLKPETIFRCFISSPSHGCEQTAWSIDRSERNANVRWRRHSLTPWLMRFRSLSRLSSHFSGTDHQDLFERILLDFPEHCCKNLFVVENDVGDWKRRPVFCKRQGMSTWQWVTGAPLNVQPIQMRSAQESSSMPNSQARTMSLLSPLMKVPFPTRGGVKTMSAAIRCCGPLFPALLGSRWSILLSLPSLFLCDPMIPPLSSGCTCWVCPSCLLRFFECGWLGNLIWVIRMIVFRISDRKNFPWSSTCRQIVALQPLVLHAKRTRSLSFG